MLYWLLKRVILGPVLRVVWRPRVEGLDNVPADGPAILASNHLSFCDSLFLPVCVPRRITYLAKAEYFTTGGIKGRIWRWFFSAVGQVPVDRADADAALNALNSGVRLLRAGNVLGIYPEGTRSPDGRLYRGKTGVARLALESGAVVVPCAMIGTDTIQPLGRMIPRLRPRPRIRIGAPLDFADQQHSGNRFVERAVTDEIMTAILRLSRQSYVDVYAATVKAKAASQAAATNGRLPGRTSATPSAGNAGMDPALRDRFPTQRAG